MLLKLQAFLKDNNLDVLDYWINEKAIICFIRVLQKKTGIFLMLKMRQFRIALDENQFINQNKYTKVYKMIESTVYEDQPETLLTYYDMLLRTIPECRKNFMYQQSNYLICNHESVYEIKANYNDNIRFFYWNVDLEWFYENINSLEYELTKWEQLLTHKMEKQCSSFLHNEDHFLKKSEKDRNTMKQVLEMYQTSFQKYQKFKKLYLKIIGMETIMKSQYLEMENVHELGTFDFNESLRKTHRKNLLRKKLQELFSLRCEAIVDVNEHWNKLHTIVLEILYFTNEMKIILSRYNTLFVDIENFIL
jgi:hypothetical protein